MRYRGGIAWVAAVAIACGAGEPRADTPAFAIIDSAGIEIVMSEAPARGGDAGWKVGAPELVLGMGQDGGFFKIVGVRRLTDGRVVVADGGSAKLRFFAVDGSAEAEFGGRGEGPGRFAELQSMGASGDTLWAYDFGKQRFALVATDASLARTVILRPRLPAAVPVGRTNQGDFVMAQLWGSADQTVPPRDGRQRQLALYVRYRPDGTLRDTLGRFPGREVVIRREDGRAVMSVAPFARTGTHVLRGERVMVGDQVDARVVEIDLTGRITRYIRWNDSSGVLTENDITEWTKAQVEAAPASERAALRAYLARAPLPDRPPAYGAALPGPNGTTWIADYALPGFVPARWTVLDARGVWLGVAEMPPGFRPYHVGPDWILGVSTDEMDVERVELRPLAPNDREAW